MSTTALAYTVVYRNKKSRNKSNTVTVHVRVGTRKATKDECHHIHYTNNTTDEGNRMSALICVNIRTLNPGDISINDVSKPRPLVN